MSEDPRLIRKEIADTQNHLQEVLKALEAKSDLKTRLEEKTQETLKASKARASKLNQGSKVKFIKPKSSSQGILTSNQAKLASVSVGVGAGLLLFKKLSKAKTSPQKPLTRLMKAPLEAASLNLESFSHNPKAPLPPLIPPEENRL